MCKDDMHRSEPIQFAVGMRLLQSFLWVSVRFSKVGAQDLLEKHTVDRGLLFDGANIGSTIDGQSFLVCTPPTPLKMPKSSKKKKDKAADFTVCRI
jgi:hypothetical protein